MKRETIAILGAGQLGYCARDSPRATHEHDVRLWARDRCARGRNGCLDARIGRYVAGQALPDAVLPTGDMNEALDGAGCVLFAVPSHGLRAVVRDAATDSRRNAVLVSATKGLETESLRRMSQVIADEIGHRGPVVVLSGPSFAVEVARGLADRRAGRIDRCRAPRSTSRNSFRGTDLPPLRERRRRRRRDRSGDEERHRHRCGRGRRAGPRSQLDGGAHHARPRRDLAPRVRRRRTTRDARRSQRTG